MTGNHVILKVLRLSYDVASWIHGAITLYTKHRCLLDTDKYNKHTGPVLCLDNPQKY